VVTKPALRLGHVALLLPRKQAKDGIVQRSEGLWGVVAPYERPIFR
jgi:hypothetical protein